MARAPSSLGIDFTPEVMAGIFVAVVVVVNCLLNIFFVQSCLGDTSTAEGYP